MLRVFCFRIGSSRTRASTPSGCGPDLPVKALLPAPEALGRAGAAPAEKAEEQAGADYVRWLDGLWSSRLYAEGTPRPSLTIGVLLWPGFSLFTLALLQEALSLAGDGVLATPPRLVLLGSTIEAGLAETGLAWVGPAGSGSGMNLPAQAPYVRPDDLDLLLVLAGPLQNARPAQGEHTRDLPMAAVSPLSAVLPEPVEASCHRDYLRVAAAAGVTVGGCGGGVCVLVQEGLLANRRFCLDHRLQADFRAAFPGLETIAAQAVVDQGRITTADGVAVLSALLPLIQARLGPEAAARVEAGLRLPPPVAALPNITSPDVHAAMAGADGPILAQPGMSSASGLPEARAIADPRIARAVVLIEARAGRDVSPSEMARAAGLSARQFSRLFRATLGMTPKHFILQTRLGRARMLVEQGTLSMAAIAEQTGFADCAHFTTAFKARYGTAPRHLRPRRAPH